ncbi:MAG: cell division protein FtsZ [Marinobacterium sp.]|nr:cell division protein FtsZ [Marinobacterium sp.]
MFELANSVAQNAVIKVVGVGGGGGNAVDHMVASDVEGVEFICANTDAQALEKMQTRTVLQIGAEMTKGLGAGANPEVGRQAAQEDRERIAEMLVGADMVFITAGMGGGTGTGAAPIVAEIAKELGILTVAVVTKPFPFEGRKRTTIALEGIKQLREIVDSLIIIPNEKLMQVLGRNASLLNAFGTANDVLKGAVQGISDLIVRPGMINVDFADVRTVMSEMGMAMMGTGVGTGEDRALVAAEAAIKSPLLEDIDLKGASGLLVNITAGLDLSLGEFSEVGSLVEEYASDEATIVVGTVIDPELSEELRVTVVATGLDRPREELRTVVDNSNKIPPQPVEPEPMMNVSYDSIELPTVLRRRQDEALLDLPGSTPVQQSEQQPVTRPAAEKVARPEKREGEDEISYLDIPTFLRRQAD